jgi:hypothetical protein
MLQVTPATMLFSVSNGIRILISVNPDLPKSMHRAVMRHALSKLMPGEAHGTDAAHRTIT